MLPNINSVIVNGKKCPCVTSSISLEQLCSALEVKVDDVVKCVYYDRTNNKYGTLTGNEKVDVVKDMEFTIRTITVES